MKRQKKSKKKTPIIIIIIVSIVLLSIILCIENTNVIESYNSKYLECNPSTNSFITMDERNTCYIELEKIEAEVMTTTSLIVILYSIIIPVICTVLMLKNKDNNKLTILYICILVLSIFMLFIMLNPFGESYLVKGIM